MRKSLVLFIGLMVFPVTGYAASASFSWLPNTESTLAGYAIYYGPDQDHIMDHQFDCRLPKTGTDGRVHCTVPDFPVTPSVAAAVAYDVNNLESDLSNIVDVNLPDVKTPVDVRIDLTVRVHVKSEK